VTLTFSDFIDFRRHPTAEVQKTVLADVYIYQGGLAVCVLDRYLETYKVSIPLVKLNQITVMKINETKAAAPVHLLFPEYPAGT